MMSKNKNMIASVVKNKCFLKQKVRVHLFFTSYVENIITEREYDITYIFPLPVVLIMTYNNNEVTLYLRNTF